MSTNANTGHTDRRKFLGSLATGAAALGISTVAAPLQTFAENNRIAGGVEDADAWFNKVKGKHRVVFDATHPNGVFPFAWPRVFLATNAATGSTEKDCGVVVVLRHDAIPYAMDTKLWEKYNFGEVFHVPDPANASEKAKKNPFWQPAPGTYKFPGIGEVQIGINELQANGVMFCVCNAALTVYSAAVAGGMGLKAEDVKKEWEAGLFPGIQIVPSGVWALGRAQEKGCAYIFAG